MDELRIHCYKSLHGAGNVPGSAAIFFCSLFCITEQTVELDLESMLFYLYTVKFGARGWRFLKRKEYHLNRWFDNTEYGGQPNGSTII
jgi:hypothetical protein